MTTCTVELNRVELRLLIDGLKILGQSVGYRTTLAEDGQLMQQNGTTGAPTAATDELRTRLLLVFKLEDAATCLEQDDIDKMWG